MISEYKKQVRDIVCEFISKKLPLIPFAICCGFQNNESRDDIANARCANDPMLCTAIWRMQQECSTVLQGYCTPWALGLKCYTINPFNIFLSLQLHVLDGNYYLLLLPLLLLLLVLVLFLLTALPYLRYIHYDNHDTCLTCTSTMAHMAHGITGCQSGTYGKQFQGIS